MIHQLDIEGRDKVDKAVMRLQAYEPPEGYYLCFSGGKDSVVIKALADMAGVKYDAHYNVTSVDPPELVQFIKREYPDVEWEYPRDKDGNRETMWTLIPKKKIPPTRMMRYCCAVLKESSGGGALESNWCQMGRKRKAQEFARRGHDHGQEDEGYSRTGIFKHSIQGNTARRYRTSFRQSRKCTNGRTMLQNKVNNGKSYH